MLANCYLNSLKLAKENNCKTIAFPNISTGVYHFPLDKAAKIALDVVTNVLTKDDFFTEVVFVCFSKENYQLYKSLLTEV